MPHMHASPQTLFHVDSDPLWCALVREAVCGILDISHSGSVGNCAGAIQHIKRTPPSIIVLNMELSDATFVRKSIKGSKIILLTAVPTEAVLYLVIENRVSGVVWKEPDAKTQLASVVAAVRDGTTMFPTDMNALTSKFRRNPKCFLKYLSEREIDLLPEFGTADSDEAVSERTGLQPTTVRSHRYSILKKLNLQNSQKLALWTIAKGFSYLARDPVRIDGYQG